MAKIIISYRRSDSDVFAGRVHDQIATRYGDKSAFIDVDNIPFGKDFRVHIQEELANADAILVIIGPKWLGPKGSRSRIMDTADPVRIEVETALSKGIPTIPILMGNARMPKPEQLPETLKDFPFLNAAPVDTSRDFHRDLNRVIATIDKILRLPLDKSDELLANDKQRAADLKAQTATEVRQTERDRIANAAEAARRRDDEERRQKAEAEARQREAERQADDVRRQERDATAQRLAQEHLQREKDAERIPLVKRAEETDKRPLTTALMRFLGSFMLIYGGLFLPITVRFGIEIVSGPNTEGVLLYLLLSVAVLAALGSGIGTIRGKPWTRIIGCGACLIGALMLVGFIYLNVSARNYPAGYFGFAATISAFLIATGLVAGALLYILEWRSDSRLARAIPEDGTVLGAFLLATAAPALYLLWAIAQLGLIAGLGVSFAATIFVTGAIYIYCLIDFRRQFNATQSRKEVGAV